MNVSFSNINKHECFKCHNNSYTRGEIFLDICPSCYNDYDKQNISTVENPIKNKILPCSIIITDSFKELNPIDYTQTSILHVGISNSKGKIYNFWNKYKVDTEKSDSMWKYVINIPLEYNILDNETFDELVENSKKQQELLYPKYDQLNNNCYAFICRLLNDLYYMNKTWTKEELAINVIEKYIILLDKYALISKELLNSELYIAEKSIDETKISYSCCDICGEMVQLGDRYRCKVCPDYDLCSSCFNSNGHEHSMNKI